jgi:hypothetical protein
MLGGMIQMLELHVISMFYVKNADKSCILVRKDMYVTEQEILSRNKLNKGNAKHSVSPCLKIWPLDHWPMTS